MPIADSLIGERSPMEIEKKSTKYVRPHIIKIPNGVMRDPNVQWAAVKTAGEINYVGMGRTPHEAYVSLVWKMHYRR